MPHRRPKFFPVCSTLAQASAGWTHIWSPTILTESWFGFQRNNPSIDPPTLGLDVRDAFGIQRSVFPAAPRFNVSGYASMGINENTYRCQIDNNFQGSSSL